MAALSVSLVSMMVGYASAYTSPALVSMNASNSTLTVNPSEVKIDFILTYIQKLRFF